MPGQGQAVKRKIRWVKYIDGKRQEEKKREKAYNSGK
jgi:hypothetical protein